MASGFLAHLYTATITLLPDGGKHAFFTPSTAPSQPKHNTSGCWEHTSTKHTNTKGSMTHAAERKLCGQQGSHRHISLKAQTDCVKKHAPNTQSRTTSTKHSWL